MLNGKGGRGFRSEKVLTVPLFPVLIAILLSYYTLLSSSLRGMLMCMVWWEAGLVGECMLAAEMQFATKLYFQEILCVHIIVSGHAIVL